MTSNKTLATLFVITLNMQRAACSSLQESAPSKMPEIATSAVSNVPLGNIQATTQVPARQPLSSWPKRLIAERFKSFMKGGKYRMATLLAKRMDDEEFLNLACSTVKTIEQFNGIVKLLRSRELMARFYEHGNVWVVKGAVIAEKGVYDNRDFCDWGAFEHALRDAFKNGDHDRVIEFLKTRQWITAEKDEHPEVGELTSFEGFVERLIFYLAPWEDRKNEVAFKRFLTLRGEELRDKHPDILDVFCERMVHFLKNYLYGPESNGKKLLIDFIGQHSLLTPASFGKGFLHYAVDTEYSTFIDYAWSEAIEEGLKKKHRWGGMVLWNLMKKKDPKKFTGDYPETAEALEAVLKNFPSKEQLETEWLYKNAPEFLETVGEIFAEILPNVPIFTVIGHARPTWLDV